MLKKVLKYGRKGFKCSTKFVSRENHFFPTRHLLSVFFRLIEELGQKYPKVFPQDNQNCVPLFLPLLIFRGPGYYSDDPLRQRESRESQGGVPKLE